jgi:hypothetical protein
MNIRKFSNAEQEFISSVSSWALSLWLIPASLPRKWIYFGTSKASKSFCFCRPLLGFVDKEQSSLTAFWCENVVHISSLFIDCSPPAWREDWVRPCRYSSKLLSVRWCVTLFKWSFAATHECGALLATYHSKHLSNGGDHRKNVRTSYRYSAARE